MLPSTAIYTPPDYLILKVSARAEKYVPPYRGDNEFSILGGGNYTFKTVSPENAFHRRVPLSTQEFW